MASLIRKRLEKRRDRQPKPRPATDAEREYMARVGEQLTRGEATRATCYWDQREDRLVCEVTRRESA